MDVDKIRSRFPVTRDRIYFDHASDGPMSAPAGAQIKRLLQIYMSEGKLPSLECLEVVKETRELAADLLKASPSELAFVKNTSQGILIAMDSIPWRPGDNVVLLKDAFPANIYPWLNLLPEVEKRWLELNGEDFLERVSDCVDERTRAVSIDWVHYLIGKRFELTELGKLCRRKGIFLIIDAIQGLGALQIDLSQVKCDFLCAGGSKWLLSPHGIGILYVSKERFDELKPSNIGWLSAKWDNFENFKVMRPLKRGAARLEEGTVNLIGIYGMRESLKIILSVGLAEIEKRIIILTNTLAKGLLELDCEILTPLDSTLRSGILSFNSPHISTKELQNFFSQQGVVCSFREGWIRLSPHFYNTEEEVKLILGLVSEAIRM